ncbi:MAG: DUF4417 domain-containing protein [Bacilli bacterium]|nr:DUF4417 domain-containing protein [Bacilli bacterium]
MTKETRKGCKDVFNAFMVKDCEFEGKYDIPICITQNNEVPTKLIAYDLTMSSTDYDAYVHFYIDDQKFDGPQGIWNKPEKALERLKKFKGVIIPDFSTYIDFPVALKIYNTYRMRAFGCYLLKNGINVIHNVRWSEPDSYEYCFSGIPKHSIISIGTIGCIKEKINWDFYQQGLDEMIKRLEPRILLVYGNTPDKFFKKYKESGLTIYQYDSQTSKAFKKEKNNET